MATPMNLSRNGAWRIAVSPISMAAANFSFAFGDSNAAGEAACMRSDRD